MPYLTPIYFHSIWMNDLTVKLLARLRLRPAEESRQANLSLKILTLISQIPVREIERNKDYHRTSGAATIKRGRILP